MASSPERMPQEAAPELLADSAEDDVISVEPPAELSSREAVFGKEGISREDVKNISEQVQALLDYDTPASAFGAARQLAHLKRARVGLSEQHKEKVFAQLNKHREAMQQADPAQQARYLIWLKYIGGIEAATTAEQKRIEQAIFERATRGQLKGLDQLCVNAKYLGMRHNAGRVQRALEKDMQQRLTTPNNVDAVAFGQARRKYLGLSPLTKEHDVRIASRINQRLARYRAEGRWGAYSRLHGAADYVRGRSAVPEATQQALVERVKTARQQAREKNDWQEYTVYVADAAMVSRRVQQAEDRRAESAGDADVGQFLDEVEQELPAGERQEKYPGQAEFEKKISELEREQRETQAPSGVSEKQAAWARSAVKQLEKGRVWGEVINEAQLMDVLQQHPAADPVREKKRLRYLTRLQDDLDYGQALREGGRLNAVLMERAIRVHTGFVLASGWQKLRVFSPRSRDRRSAWTDTITARGDVVASLKAAAADDRLDGRTRTFAHELAQVYDQTNQLDKAELRRRSPKARAA